MNCIRPDHWICRYYAGGHMLLAMPIGDWPAAFLCQVNGFECVWVRIPVIHVIDHDMSGFDMYHRVCQPRPNTEVLDKDILHAGIWCNRRLIWTAAHYCPQHFDWHDRFFGIVSYLEFAPIEMMKCILCIDSWEATLWREWHQNAAVKLCAKRHCLIGSMLLPLP